MGKVLVIGLDGAGWNLFGPWADAGRLPALAALRARGTWGTLRSTVPALTLPAWSSFMTGKNPGAHGVYGFRRMAPDRYDGAGLANATDLRAATIWDTAAASGKRVGVINVPPSYPIRPIPSGFVVGCMLTPPGQPFTNPPEVADELGEYEIDLPPPKGLRRSDADYRARALAYLRGMIRQTRLRGEATLRVMAARPTDALCVVFYAPDRVQHYFWEYVDPAVAAGPKPDAEVAAALTEAYATLDRAVGRLVEAAGAEATIVVLSDHGFGTKPAHSVHINRWLADQGLLRRHPFWQMRRRVIRKVFPEPWRTRYDTTDHVLVDRRRSRAWSEAIFTGTAGIWIHVRGRYPQGCVEPGSEYEAVRDTIRRGLSGLEGPGGRVFSDVWRREDVYRGPFVNRAPDLIAQCRRPFGVVFESLRRELRSPRLFAPYEELGYTGTHDPDGLYLFAGPPFGALGKHEPLPIEAVGPTVLYTMGVAIPRDMEAAPCLSAIAPVYVAGHPVEYCDPVAPVEDGPGGWRSGDDESQIADHLRALGYLE